MEQSAAASPGPFRPRCRSATAGDPPALGSRCDHVVARSRRSRDGSGDDDGGDFDAGPARHAEDLPGLVHDRVDRLLTTLRHREERERWSSTAWRRRCRRRSSNLRGWPTNIASWRRSRAQAPMMLIHWMGARLPGRYRAIGHDWTIVTSIPSKKRNLPGGSASSAIIIGIADGRSRRFLPQRGKYFRPPRK